MNTNIMRSLIDNTALLLVLFVVYEISYYIPDKYKRLTPIVRGLMTSLICILIMSVPFVLETGLVFDTRSILISVTALIFGIVPTAITVVIASIYRLITGGIGAVPGVAVIIASALIGLAWRQWIYSKSKKWNWLKIFAMGITVHVVMLLCMLLLPYPNNFNTINKISFSVLLIYPIATFFLATLLVQQSEHRQIQHELKESEERFQLLFNKAPLGYQSLDFYGNFIDVNQQWLDTFGYKKEDLIDKKFVDFIAPDSKELFVEKLPLFMSQGQIQCELEMLHKNGDILHILFEGKIGYDEIENYKQSHCILQDITEKKNVEKALIESEKKYRNYIENAPNAVFVVDSTGKYIDANKAATAITGYSKEELLKMTIKDITCDFATDDALNAFNELVGSGIIKTILPFTHKDGSKHWWTVDATKLSENRFLGFSNDITDRKRAEDDLIYANYHDYMTNLYNRKYFEEALISIDKKDNLPISIIIADINGVRLINDAFGFAAGDTLIKETSNILLSCCREGDVLARVGGDEFALILPNTDNKETEKTVNSINEACETFNKNNPGNYYEINLSIGYETKSNTDESIEKISNSADENLRNQKLLNIKSFRSNLISSMMATVYEKSRETDAHAKRLADLSKKIGEKLKLPQNNLKELELLSVLHDIGKVAIDDEVLKKPGKLDDEDWIIMKTHPEIGYRIAKSTSELEGISEYIRTHHERWDGKGYPQGLKEKDIPLLSRIISVVDAYDAMTNDRIYRKAFSEEFAIEELKKNAGSQFDPSIVDIFVEIIGSQNKPTKGNKRKSTP